MRIGLADYYLLSVCLWKMMLHMLFQSIPTYHEWQINLNLHSALPLSNPTPCRTNQHVQSLRKRSVLYLKARFRTWRQSFLTQRQGFLPEGKVSYPKARFLTWREGFLPKGKFLCWREGCLPKGQVSHLKGRFLTQRPGFSPEGKVSYPKARFLTWRVLTQRPGFSPEGNGFLPKRQVPHLTASSPVHRPACQSPGGSRWRSGRRWPFWQPPLSAAASPCWGPPHHRQCSPPQSMKRELAPVNERYTVYCTCPSKTHSCV